MEWGVEGAVEAGDWGPGVAAAEVEARGATGTGSGGDAAVIR